MNNEEIESLRAELRDCQIGIEQRNDLIKRMETELDRMRTALGDVDAVLCDSSGKYKSELDRTVAISAIVHSANVPRSRRQK